MSPEVWQILCAIAGAALGWLAHRRTAPELSEVEKSFLEALKPKLAEKRANEAHEALADLIITTSKLK